ncbi:MAG: DUF11 domain-containing protein [Chromatiales bacterium]|nr:DUF11 domain-containing protein [Chromatiales bacterium]
MASPQEQTFAKSRLAYLSASFASLLLTLTPTSADTFPPDFAPVDESNGPVHFAPAAWPSEPALAADCAYECGEWKPYTRFQNDITDPRTQDPSNGGTRPQNYVNVASSCIDQSYPSIYYHLYRHPVDPAQDVIMFRWRVEQIANTYATGPSPGNFSATDPWGSALWTVLFDVDGDGYRDLAAHLDGSSGSPAEPVDLIAGIWGNIPTQSLDYLDDPDNIKLIAHNPTAFTQGSQILNFHDDYPTNPPDTLWPAGASSDTWDYGTSRSKLVYTNSCTEYFIDYQIPVRMLDASADGPNPALNGPKITRDTPISMLFCTANSLNDPFQKDCSLNRTYLGDTNKPAPYGDYLSFNKAEPYSQPIISSVTASAPATCPGIYTLNATVQDVLYVDDGGAVQPSVQSVDFFYWYDRDGDGTTMGDTGSEWIFAASGAVVPGTLNQWTASWDATSLARGKYLIGVQALDDKTLHDDGVPDAPVDNRTFSYLQGSTDSATQSQIYSNDWSWDGITKTWIQGVDIGWISGQEVLFPPHVPIQTPGVDEDWYGNPDVTGIQTAIIGVAINACGVAPTIGKTASPTNVATGEPVNFTITIGNDTGNTVSVTQIDDLLPTGFSYQSTTSIAVDATPLGANSEPTPADMGTISWTFGAGVDIPDGSQLTLIFVANAGSDAGTYNNSAQAISDFGTLTSPPVTVQVDAARLSLSKTPNTYLAQPDGSTQLIYTLRYANDSAVTVTAASITDVLPADTTYVSCSGGLSCGNNLGTVSWDLGTLAGGESGTVTLAITVNTGYPSGSLTNAATLEAIGPDSNPISVNADATVAVNVPTPAFSLVKTADAVQIAPAGTVVWTLSYENYGSAAASGVLITDPLPDGFSFLGCSTTGSSHFSGCTNTADTVTFHDGSGGGVSVPSGASGSVTITAQAAPDPFTYPNPARNTGTITWTGNPTGVQANSDVGVTGQFCSAVYYFHGGNSADQIAPTAAVDTTNTFNITSSTPGQILFTSAPSPEALTITGQTLTVNFYLSSLSGSISFQVTLRNVTQAQNIAVSPTSTVGNSGGALELYTFTANVGQDINAGDVLQWQFDFTTTSGANKDISFYYDSTSANSRSSFCTATAPANLVLAKTVDKSNIPSAAGTLNYVLTYANAGGTAATGVNLVDTLPTDVTCNQYTDTCTDFADVPATCSNWTSCSGGSVTLLSSATLNPGDSGQFAVQADVGGSASGTLTNSATLSATGTDPSTATADTVVGSLSPGGGTPALTISKSVDRSLLTAGQTATYTLTVVNVGDGTANNVVISDDFPDQTYFTLVPASCSPSAGGCAVNGAPADSFDWTLGSLTAGNVASLSFQMVAGTSGLPAGITLLDNSATVADDDYCTGGSPPASCTSNTVTVTLSASPVLDIVKTSSDDNGGDLEPGDTLTYTLVVTNSGSADANGVVVTDPIPDHTAFLGGITANPGMGSFDTVDNRVVFDVGTLAAGANATLSFQAGVLSPLDSGTTVVLNTATATASNAPQRQDSANDTTTAAPVLTLKKSGPASAAYPSAVLTADAVNATELSVESSAQLALGQVVLIGAQYATVTQLSDTGMAVDTPINASNGDAVIGSVRYGISYRNTGNADSTNTVLTDTLPAGLTFYAADPAADSAPAIGDSGAIVWNLGTVAAGSGDTVGVTVFPTGPGTVLNTAAIESTEIALPVTDDAQTLFGGLSVTKETSTPISTAGGIASYLITVTNSTATPINTVEVKDQLSAGFTYAAGTALVNGASQEPVLDNGDAGRPVWAVDVPANGSTTIAFDADIAANVGTATYQNEVELIKAGVGILPFDALATTREDVTVLGADKGLLEGYVFFDDGSTPGALDDADTRYANVPVVASRNGASCWPQTVVNAYSADCYVVYTDANGFFRLAAPTGDWLVDVIDGQGQLPSGLSIVVGSDTTIVTIPSQATVQDLNGFAIPAATYTLGGLVFRDEDDSGLPNGGEAGTNAGGLFALLVDSGGNLVNSTAVAANGAFTFGGVTAGDYEVRLSTSAGTIGLPAPAAALPASWFSTGESLDGLATDGLADGSLNVSIVAADQTALRLGVNTAAAVPAPTPVPTLQAWVLLAMGILLILAAGTRLRESSGWSQDN